VTAVAIDVVHPGLRATAASLAALVQNLFGLAAGPFIAGVLSDVYGLQPALSLMSVFGLFSALAFVIAASRYEADLAGAASIPITAETSAPSTA
jgi:MFS family permease